MVFVSPQARITFELLVYIAIILLNTKEVKTEYSYSCTPRKVQYLDSIDINLQHSYVYECDCDSSPSRPPAVAVPEFTNAVPCIPFSVVAGGLSDIADSVLPFSSGSPWPLLRRRCRRLKRNPASANPRTTSTPITIPAIAPPER